MKIKTFFIGVLVILAVYSLGGWGFSELFNFSRNKNDALWISGIINTINIVAAFLITEFTIKKEAKQFMRIFFTGMGIRILLLLIAIISILKFTSADQFTFIVSLFILYVLYQIWEIWLINSYLRKE